LQKRAQNKFRYSELKKFLKLNNFEIIKLEEISQNDYNIEEDIQIDFCNKKVLE